MSKRLVTAAFLTSIFSLQSAAQSHSGFPVEIGAGPAPQLVMAQGRAHLVYELHLTNYAPLSVELNSIDVFGTGAAPLASYRGDALAKLIVPVEKLFASGPVGSSGNTLSIGEGHSAVVFVDLPLDPGARPPAQLRHRLSFSIVGKNGAPIEKTVDTAVIDIVKEPAPVLHAPVRGVHWVAFNALGADDHRRAVVAVDGKMGIAQRFAIDWMCLGPDGQLFHGDTKSNANYYDYGVNVLAVADARVSDSKDGIPDNVGSSERSDRVITLDNVVGNYLILDLGKGRFALYAHLQPGSLKVKLGDHVEVGQVLALLGNSGNSDAPHLHFQLMDVNSSLGAEGIPYELESFTQLGTADDSDDAKPWRPKPNENPIVHQREFPVNNTVVNLP